MGKMIKNRKKGFTMAELLIVVAIIAVLVAVAVPVFSGQLEKSREAVDIANLRDAYARIASKAMGNPDDATLSETVEFKQQKPGWTGDTPRIGGIDISQPTSDNVENGPVQFTNEGDTVNVYWKTDTKTVVFQMITQTGGG